MDLNDKKIGLTKKRIESLNALGINDVNQLLSYYPFRYDVINVKPYEQWQLKEKIYVEGKVASNISTVRFGRKKTISRFDIQSDDRIFHISIFNRPWAKQLKMDDDITIHGIFMGKNNITAISYVNKPISEQDRITPQYSTKAGIQQRTIRDSIRKILDNQEYEISNIIPDTYIEKYKLLDRRVAINYIHRPNTEEEISEAYRTLKYEEFLKYFTSLRILKNNSELIGYKDHKVFDKNTITEWIQRLPFPLTKDQETSINEIISDISSSKVMYRLLQGDVGSGKTLVAGVALYANALAGFQGALLAPTEILARQHYENFMQLFKDTDLRIAVLFSGEDTRVKNNILNKLQDGELDIVIGTHSLIQEGVSFDKLGLVVADEQQRFGVAQRRALKEKGKNVDFLLMSATPIPRTLASTFYGDMDISTIETMPPGRKQVKTTLIQENSFRSVIEDVNELLSQGRQLYVICAAIEKSDNYDARNVIDIYNALKKQYDGYKTVGFLHGRMSSEEKQQVMDDFNENKIQILVSTTVVEVGVNVVNATGMIIYDADRFGMSQIHQLRGRIQRGSHQGYCWLLTDSKDEKTLERLNVLVNNSDGFKISYEDLRLRGPGDVLGTKQSGFPDIILGNIIEDQKIITQAQKDAIEICSDMENPNYKKFIDIIESINKDNVSYID